MVDDRRAAFCARLKASRERKGVALQEIAAATKVARSLLKGLEENDLSRWPQGIYRRAYLRDYLRAIDLPEQSIVAEFVRLFPDNESPLPGKAGDPESEEPCALSMTLAEGKTERLEKTRNHATAATIDLAVVLSLSALAWWLIRPTSGPPAPSSRSVITRSGRRPLDAVPARESWKIGAGGVPGSPGHVPNRVVQDTLLTRLREAKGLPTQSEPAMTGTGGLFSVLVVSVVRTLFLR